MVAFNFVKTCGIVPLYKAVTETYQLQKIQQHLIPKLQKLLTEGFYRDVRLSLFDVQMYNIIYFNNALFLILGCLLVYIFECYSYFWFI